MIKINSCNNIDNGEISIQNNHLNIKYAFNGTGKSTISTAIKATIENDEDLLRTLVPFKHKEDEAVIPNVDGLDDYKSVMIFNDEYVEQYVFQSDELIKDSFNIFVRTPAYDQHMDNIEKLISEIHNTFKDDEEIEELIHDLQDFLKSYGNTKTGYAKSSILGKALGTGNKLENIPSEISQYTPFLNRAETNVKWLKWQLQGKEYYVSDDICPYCANDIEHDKEKIEKVRENFDSKEIDSLNKIIDIFERFKKYFSNTTNTKIEEISKNITGISTEQKSFLTEIRNQVNTLRSKLEGLNDLGYISLNNSDEKVMDAIKNYKIDISYLPHLESDIVKEKIEKINDSIDMVLSKVGELQGEINQQRNTIKNTIEKYNTEINGFLNSAGYDYSVNIEENNGEFKLRLFHNDYEGVIPGTERHLSYGERNAFALALFMYSALNDNPDLIILDDPISSFDGNKKFAIINMLFMGSNSFKDKTVLLLTHEFNIVIDTIYNFKHKILPTPTAYFLSTENGTLSEKEIKKEDIKSFVGIARDKLNSSIDIINKLIYLRRWLELEETKNEQWNLLSSLFHKRANPTKRVDEDEIEMTNEEISSVETSISESYDLSFNYSEQYNRVIDFNTMKSLYNSCNCNYEKLQIFRIIFDGLDLNDVVKKFINETYHIENDYIFQLDPNEYNTIPQYIIEICDDQVNSYKPMIAKIEVDS